jgi:uncharacterized DUF497 family protein
MFQDQCEVGWDETKAQINFRKHGVSFEWAKQALGDPLAVTQDNFDHGRAEERWITLGEVDGKLLHVVHTLEETDAEALWARIISARYPTPDERRQYESGQYRIEEAVVRINKSNPDQWVRGRFYREGMVIIGPVNVERDLVARLSQMANQRGTSPSAVANELLRHVLGDDPSSGAPETTKAQTPV